MLPKCECFEKPLRYEIEAELGSAMIATFIKSVDEIGLCDKSDAWSVAFVAVCLMRAVGGVRLGGDCGEVERDEWLGEKMGEILSLIPLIDADMAREIRGEIH